jgi:hypothetical protein
LQLDGKLGRRRGQLNALGGLIHLQDSVSNQQFLVDTGAVVSVFPHRSAAASSGPILSGADGKPLSAWGKVTKKLNFGLHTFVVSFVLAAVSKPILGIDFFVRSLPAGGSFCPSHSVRRFLEGGRRLHCRRRPIQVCRVHISHRVPAVRTLLAAFPSIVGDGKDIPRPRHGVRHFVETSGRPDFAKARSLDPDKLKIAVAEFRSLEAAGIVRRSMVVSAPRAQGGWFVAALHRLSSA